jgi:hypothetical protein
VVALPHHSDKKIKEEQAGDEAAGLGQGFVGVGGDEERETNADQPEQDG